MRKVTTISLNNNAYQVEEEGYEALRGYLSAAELNLAGNPDRAEILSDLELAIGEKCRNSLGPHKTVVTREDVDRILAEMGPVTGPEAHAGTPGGATAGDQPAAATPGAAARKRLYRLEEGKMWAGVCAGLGAYFGFDPVWVRLAFILLTLFSTGIFLLVYILMCFVIPMAETAGERAAAHGAPFNAQELIDSIKKKSEDLKANPDRFARRNARREARAERRRMRRSYWEAREAENPGRPGYAARVTGSLLLPVLTILSAAWFIAMAVAMLAVWISLDSTGSTGWFVDGWELQMPRWVALVIVFVLYALVAMPLAAGRRASLYYANGGRSHGWADAWSGLLWVALVGLAFLAAWQFVPGLQDGIRGLLQGHSASVAWI